MVFFVDWGGWYYISSSLIRIKADVGCDRVEFGGPDHQLVGLLVYGFGGLVGGWEEGS